MCVIALALLSLELCLSECSLVDTPLFTGMQRDTLLILYVSYSDIFVADIVPFVLHLFVLDCLTGSSQLLSPKGSFIFLYLCHSRYLSCSLFTSGITALRINFKEPKFPDSIASFIVRKNIWRRIRDH